jgi:selenocysteine lyase/cysteine desulfurase
MLKDIESYRSQFPITDKYTFLNHAAVSPASLRVVMAVEALYREYSRCGIACYPKWMKRIADARSLFARLIHAEPDEIAFVGNTSDGLSTIAGGLGWKSGDVVLVSLPDFPANIYPWLNLERLGVKVRFVERKGGRFGPEEIEKAMEPGVKLLAVSWVDFATGFRCDLEALGDFCRRKSILLSVDAIQGLGVVPMDVKKWGVHFLAAGGHKWLLGTMGIGGLYVSREVIHRVHPMRVGWKSVCNEEDFFNIRFDLKPDALRFETGTMNLAGITALGAAVELILEVGVENIHERIVELNDMFREGLKKRNLAITTSMVPDERSGILCFVPETEPQNLFRLLAERNVMISARGKNIRLSPHFYNNSEDVENFFRALDD